WFRTATPVAVLYRGIEIDGVFRVQRKLIAADLNGHGPLDNKQEFHPGMRMRLRLFRPNLLKICHVRANFTFRGVIIQALKVIRDIGYSRPLREAHPLLFSYYSYQVSLALVGKEEVQPQPKHHGNA